MEPGHWINFHRASYRVSSGMNHSEEERIMVIQICIFMMIDYRAFFKDSPDKTRVLESLAHQ